MLPRKIFALTVLSPLTIRQVLPAVLALSWLKILSRHHALSHCFPALDVIKRTFFASMYKYFDISTFLFALLRENPARSTAVFPSFRATTIRTQCVCKEDRYIQIAFTARRLRQRGHHATSFCPYGKTCTASFRGYAWQNAILPRFIYNNHNAVRRKQ